MTDRIHISFDINIDEAEALAQLAKRISHTDCARLSSPQEDPFQMLYGVEKLRQALADAGFSPR